MIIRNSSVPVENVSITALPDNKTGNSGNETVLQPMDEFVSDSGGGEKKGRLLDRILGGVFRGIDFRVPTLSKSMTDEKIAEVMNSVEPGDILLFRFDSQPHFSHTIKALSGSNYTHAGFYEKDGKFIHAMPDGVSRVDLAEHLKGNCYQVRVVRPDYKTDANRDSAVSYVADQVGKSYDIAFNTEDDSKQYCSEIVCHALEKMPDPINVPRRSLFGKKIIPPDVFDKIEGSRRIYDSGSSFVKSILNLMPFAGPAMVAGVVAGAVLSPLAGIGTLLGSGILSSMTGNLITEGSFSMYPQRNSQNC